MKFVKKPVEIEAIQFTEKSVQECLDFINAQCTFNKESGESEIIILTLEGLMTAKLGDWIIKGVKGEFYPCKPDIFEATYDRVRNHE